MAGDSSLGKRATALTKRTSEENGVGKIVSSLAPLNLRGPCDIGWAASLEAWVSCSAGRLEAWVSCLAGRLEAQRLAWDSSAQSTHMGGGTAEKE